MLAPKTRACSHERARAGAGRLPLRPPPHLQRIPTHCQHGGQPDDVALAVDAPRQCATPAAATPRPEETAFDNSFFTAGCEKVAERDAHTSTFGLRQLMYAPDDRHDVAVLISPTSSASTSGAIE